MRGVKYLYIGEMPGAIAKYHIVQLRIVFLKQETLSKNTMLFQNAALERISVLYSF